MTPRGPSLTHHIECGGMGRWSGDEHAAQVTCDDTAYLTQCSAPVSQGIHGILGDPSTHKVWLEWVPCSPPRPTSLIFLHETALTTPSWTSSPTRASVPRSTRSSFHSSRCQRGVRRSPRSLPLEASSSLVGRVCVRLCVSTQRPGFLFAYLRGPVSIRS